MKLLLDTHAVLWFMNNSDKLSSKADKIMQSETASSYLSIASVWEIVIKSTLNKLRIEDNVHIFLAKIQNSPIRILSVSMNHIKTLSHLPYHHKDPFDRMIVATAISENMTIITKDGNIQKYNIPTIW
jgi:PIN domain nuclease of toxin-antitoxin system